MKDDEANYLAMIANLVSVYHLTPEQIGDLTYWQIKHIYYHPRDEKGHIVPQIEEVKAGTFEFEIVQAKAVAKEMNLDAAELVKEVKNQWKSKTKNSKQSSASSN